MAFSAWLCLEPSLFGLLMLYLLRSKQALLLGAKGIATGNKKLLGAPCIATRSKDAIRLGCV